MNSSWMVRNNVESVDNINFSCLDIFIWSERSSEAATSIGLSSKELFLLLILVIVPHE